MAEDVKVGFIGLGNMGGGMSANILKAGFPLTVHDLNRDAATQLLENGADWADTPAELAASCDVVFTSLPGPRRAVSPWTYRTCDRNSRSALQPAVHKSRLELWT